MTDRDTYTYIVNYIILEKSKKKKKKHSIYKETGASNIFLHILKCLRTWSSTYQSSTCTLSNQEHDGIIMGNVLSTCTNDGLYYALQEWDMKTYNISM